MDPPDLQNEYTACRALQVAAEAGDWDTVWAAFDAAACGKGVLTTIHLGGRMDNDTSLLMIAVKQAHMGAIDGLRQRGVDPNVAIRQMFNGSIYRTALNVAVECNRLEVVQALLRFEGIDHRVPMVAAKWWPLTMCMRATVDEDIARLIIGLLAEVPPAARDGGVPWIRSALKTGVPERIDWVLAKFDLNAHPALSVKRELCKAIQQLASVKWLFTYAEATRQPLDIEYCFWEATRAAAADTMEYFLTLGASTSKLYPSSWRWSDTRDRSVLLVAFEGIANERQRLQIKLGMDGYVSTATRTRWLSVCEELETRSARIMRLLLQHGADPNGGHTERAGRYAFTPLVWAIKVGEAEAAMALLQWRSDATPLLRLDTVIESYDGRARGWTVWSYLRHARDIGVISRAGYGKLVAELDAYPAI
jgi:hypothetical protein